MKVLFAVNNEKISEAIIKKYQAMYKEIISWKNVYFFNAIIKELQKDKSYDRIVIGEDLEPYTSNNYEVIDNILFDKLDSISDEASNSRDGDIPIILIATDRRDKGNALLVKLFGIGIYNVLLGQDRKIDSVCKLINQPRTKKEAKTYYRIDSDDVEYQSIDPDSVNELEIQNIIRHYKKLGKNESAYVTSFDEIATQYTDPQLKVITKFLPLNVRAVLEEKSPKYQQVMIGSVKNQVASQSRGNRSYTARNIESKNINKIDLIDKELQKAKLTKPVVIPSAINMQNVKKAYTNTKKVPMEEVKKAVSNNVNENVNNDLKNNQLVDFNTNFDFNNQIEDYNDIQNTTNIQEASNIVNQNATNIPDVSNMVNQNVVSQRVEEQNVETVKKGRGRPKKEKTPEELAAEENKVKKGRGRPKKIIEEPVQNVENSANEIDLFALVSNDGQNEQDSNAQGNLKNDIQNDEKINQKPQTVEETTQLPGENDGFSLPGFNDNDEDIQLTNNAQNTNNYNDDFFGNDLSLNELPGMNNFDDDINNINDQTTTKQTSESYNDDLYNDQYNNQYTNDNKNDNLYTNNQFIDNNYTNNNQYTTNNNTQIENVNTIENNSNLANLITGDKKIVAFVGTSKNGTSFLVNNLATSLSGKGINTAILDLTKNKNAYYIYTSNEDSLREKAFKCIDGLRSGVADGITVNKNLTVYTTLPGENPSFNDYSNILGTLAKKYSVILLDCDFDTNLNYFANSQEIYLVQTYDILTIQPLTAFLNEMKHKNILDQNKLRIIINKTLKLRKLTEQMIIGGISCYNDPASTYINTLFDKDKIRYTTIPFEDQTYARYLERLVDCEISLNGYSKIFLDALEKLSNMVYPLIAGNVKYPQQKNYNDYNKKNTNTTFNNDMNATLNKMRNNF